MNVRETENFVHEVVSGVNTHFSFYYEVLRLSFCQTIIFTFCSFESLLNQRNWNAFDPKWKRFHQWKIHFEFVWNECRMRRGFAEKCVKFWFFRMVVILTLIMFVNALCLKHISFMNIKNTVFFGASFLLGAEIPKTCNYSSENNTHFKVTKRPTDYQIFSIVRCGNEICDFHLLSLYVSAVSALTPSPTPSQSTTQSPSPSPHFHYSPLSLLLYFCPWWIQSMAKTGCEWIHD